MDLTENNLDATHEELIIMIDQAQALMADKDSALNVL